MTALAHGKRPIVVPRRATFGEAVDDHQLLFAVRAGELGLVHALETEDHLADAVRALDATPMIASAVRSPIEVELRQYIQETLGRKSPLQTDEERVVAWS
jgi:UDP-N-acetylglucosamine transferase subunit ALG13